MREITILKDGIRPRMPKITKNIRNILYVILAVSLIAAAIIKRADYLDPSNMVTNIAVIAMVAYPVAVIFTLLIKLIMGLFTCDEFTVTSRRIFGFELFGRPADIAVSDISEVSVSAFIFKILTVRASDERVYRFVGLRCAERITDLINHLKHSKSLAGAADTASDTAALLREYEALRQKGIITASELEGVRKQIVGL